LAEKDKKTRCFIALELSKEAKEELARIIDFLKDSGSDVKWVSPAGVHLTLKFLGYTDEEKIGRIALSLKEIAAGQKPFDVLLNAIGVFPGWSAARVLWVGVGEGADKVKTLAGEVASRMQKEGFEEETRPFSAHLTLGRIRSGKNKDRLKALAEKVDVRPASSHIERIILFKSDLTPQGAVYTPLEIVRFNV